MHLFLDRKEQSHLLFQRYLPMYRSYCRFERFSNTRLFLIGAAAPLVPPATPLYTVQILPNSNTKPKLHNRGHTPRNCETIGEYNVKLAVSSSELILFLQSNSSLTIQNFLYNSFHIFDTKGTVPHWLIIEVWSKQMILKMVRSNFQLDFANWVAGIILPPWLKKLSQLILFRVRAGF